MKTQSYSKFWLKIHKAAKNNGFPLRVMFELTYRCNFKCRHCYIPENYRKNVELKTKKIFSIIDQLKEMGCLYLGFTGGEPFLRKDIIKILWYAKKRGFQIIIYTNGSFIDEEIAEELKYINPNKIDITISAMSKSVFEQINGVRGSRDKVFKAIDILHKKGVKLGFKTCVLKENESEIKNIQNFAASLGVLHRLDIMLSPRLDGSREPYKYRGNLEKTGPEVKSRVNPKTRCLLECGTGVSQAAITPQGELKMCVMIDYPKYKILTKARGKKSNLKDSWQRLKSLADNIKMDEDYHCDKYKLESYFNCCPARWMWLKSIK